MEGMECDWSMCWNLNIWDVFHTSGTHEAEYRKEVVSGRRVAGPFRSN